MQKNMNWWIILGILIFFALIPCAKIWPPNSFAQTDSTNDINPNNENLSSPKDIHNLLNHGKAIVDLPNEMTQDITNIVNITIVTSDITIGETVEVAPLMEANLIGQDFEIMRITGSEQAVTDNSNTTWSWDVTPSKTGEQHLSFAFKKGDKKDEIIYKNVSVKANPTKGKENYSNHVDFWYYYLICALIAVLLGLAYSNYRWLYRPRPPESNLSNKLQYYYKEHRDELVYAIIFVVLASLQDYYKKHRELVYAIIFAVLALLIAEALKLFL
jgi:hypothetical protein